VGAQHGEIRTINCVIWVKLWGLRLGNVRENFSLSVLASGLEVVLVFVTLRMIDVWRETRVLTMRGLVLAGREEQG
jgi:hypothetical protein